MMKKIPKVSFCIATYKRPVFLRKTLRMILAQGVPNIEIIVNDNDPEGSSQKVVDAFRSKNIRYFKNKKNVGMVKNFNAAFSHARGEYVTLITDDDPPEPHMLKTLFALEKKYPKCSSYFGASYLYTNDPAIAEIYHLNLGKTTRKNVQKKDGEVMLYSPQTFLKDFFSYNIFPYFLWSTGIIRRSVALKIHGMPDYGSPFLTDYTFIALVGTAGKMAIVNTELGGQTLHMGNFGRSREDLLLLLKGVQGLHKRVFPLAKKYGCEKVYKEFITGWIIGHMIGLSKYHAYMQSGIQPKELFALYDTLCRPFPFFAEKRYELYMRVLYPKQYERFRWFIDIFRKGKIQKRLRSMFS